MNIYFSGIGGVGIGPLAQIAADMGHTVTGTDLTPSLVTRELEERGIPITFGQDGSYLRECHEALPIDWFVHTAGLPDHHPELQVAAELGIKISKRDELLAMLIKEKGLSLIAISGSHGKTTTTGMTIWAMQHLGEPVSYSVGTTISFGPSGHYEPGSRYFVYECDEFDRNFLHFFPTVSLITSIEHDHPDTYPTSGEYAAAFRQFIGQSEHTILWDHDAQTIELPAGDTCWRLRDEEVLSVSLAGAHNRRNASLVAKAVEYLDLTQDIQRLIGVLESFPGTDRRFEKLAENLYSDYGHHPSEIAATLQLARELSNDVVLVYQPHQNRRQHEIKNDYIDQFELATTTYWLPTYLSREDPDLPILLPIELSAHVTNRDTIIVSEFDDTLWEAIETARARGALVLCMGAGSIDGWVRQRLAS
jgi:UDP-N-acetylmuramate--alanine ligase